MKQQSSLLSSYEIRHVILELSARAHVGHIGCALSIADIMVALYANVLNIKKPSDPQRDRFVLSKGHAAPALYAALHLRGWISKEELHSFHGDDTRLGVHPELGVAGVEVATGSLGQGLSVAAGIALAGVIKKEKWHVYVIVSDAECNEGSIWEAAAFASQHRLSNLTVIVDHNRQQGFGYTQDVISSSFLEDKWKAFGWKVDIADGHDVKMLTHTLLQKDESLPHTILADTVLGKGVSFMERKVDWHYLPLNDDLYQQALEEIKIFDQKPSVSKTRKITKRRSK